MDLTSKAQWKQSIGEIGSIDGNGQFTANDMSGETKISAVYEGLESNSISIKVNMFMALTIQGENVSALGNCPFAWCYLLNAGATARFSVLGQDSANFRGDRTDLTQYATWETSDASISINKGALTATKTGVYWIRATVGDARSDKAWIVVLDGRNSDFLIMGTNNINMFKPALPIKIGESLPLSAILYEFRPNETVCPAPPVTNIRHVSRYSTIGNWQCAGIGITATDVTSAVSWNITPDNIGTMSSGRFTGNSPGFVDIAASLNGLKSNALRLDVWDYRDMKFCNADQINSGEWHDEQTKAAVETDCGIYKKGESVNIRYTASLTGDRFYLDNCLDLYVLNENGGIVKTLREEGCSTESLSDKRSTKKTGNEVYQTISTWDMKDNNGAAVPAGNYYATARFYILWEPVIRVPFTITE